MSNRNAIVLLAEGFEDIEAVTAIDVLRRGGVDVTTASVGASLDVASSHGITMRADARLADLGGDVLWDAVVLPGGMPGTKNLADSPLVIDVLRRHKAAERLLCAICAAPTVLVGADVLDPDTHITCYPACSVDLDRPCASVPVVADGHFVTGQGPGSSLLFSLVVLKMLLGDSAAGKVAQSMVTDVLQG